jgi:hypothetical protein
VSFIPSVSETENNTTRTTHTTPQGLLTFAKHAVARGHILTLMGGMGGMGEGQVHTYTHIHSYTHTYTHTLIYTHIHSYTHTYTHIHTHTLIYTHIHSYTHTYTHIHTHTH